jgi:hypothetical protein
MLRFPKSENIGFEHQMERFPSFFKASGLARYSRFSDFRESSLIRWFPQCLLLRVSKNLKFGHFALSVACKLVIAKVIGTRHLGFFDGLS